jgi:hypothetical protein
MAERKVAKLAALKANLLGFMLAGMRVGKMVGMTAVMSSPMMVGERVVAMETRWELIVVGRLDSCSVNLKDDVWATNDGLEESVCDGIDTGWHDGVLDGFIEG